MAGVRRVSDVEVQINAQFGGTVNTTSLDQTLPVGVLFSTGQGAVIYQDPYDPNPPDIDIQANFLSASTGRPTGVQIAAPGLGFSGRVDLHPQAAVLANVADPSIAQNRALVVWDNLIAANNHDIFGRLVTANGDTLNVAPFPISATANNEEFPDVAALPNGRSAIVWQNTNLGSISANILNVDGQTQFLAPFRVDTAGTAGLPSTNPVVAALGNNFVVAWRGDDVNLAGIHAQVFDQNGTRIGNELGLAANPLNTSTTGLQTEPAITALSGGGFVVAWTDASTRADVNGATDASGTAIKFRVFNAGATAVTGEILANTSFVGDQNHASVVARPDGGFVIGWTDSGQAADAFGTLDASGLALKAQAFTATGAKIGGDLLVNHITAGNQDFLNLSTAADGGILAVFQDDSHLVDGGQTPDTLGIGVQSVRLTVDLPDTTPPTVAITTPGGTVRSAALTVAGTVGIEDAGTTVRILEGATQLGTGTVGANGAFSVGVTLSGNGPHSLVASDTDAAGNVGTSGAVAFNLSVGTPAHISDVFRFFDVNDGGHFFTTNLAERAGVLATRPDLKPEGIGFQAFDDTQVAGSTAVFRFFDTHDGGHFFTANTAERDTVLATRPDLRFEGTGFFEFATTQGAKSDAVYRFFDTHDGGHFFTSNVAERDAVLATRPDLKPEGIAFYAPHSGVDFLI